MPGYEAERDRLREHLGIEWIQNGLSKSGRIFEKAVLFGMSLAQENMNLGDSESCVYFQKFQISKGK